MSEDKTLMERMRGAWHDNEGKMLIRYGSARDIARYGDKRIAELTVERDGAREELRAFRESYARSMKNSSCAIPEVLSNEDLADWLSFGFPLKGSIRERAQRYADFLRERFCQPAPQAEQPAPLWTILP